MEKKIAVIGLGLIGGSIALALRGFEDAILIGVDTDEQTLRCAVERGAADRVTANAEAALREADLIFLCLHPGGILRFLKEHAHQFRPGALVTDVCGIKTAIVEAAKALPEGVSFIGGHPMAGREKSGIGNADAKLFHGAHYILTPEPGTDPGHIGLMRRIAGHMGCKDLVETTAERHDRLIAYTSQIMHIMAAAVCDDPALFDCRGFEGNSFRDCTRVAALDVPLWTELFSFNAPALCGMIARLEDNLRAYRETLEAGDVRRLTEKLAYSSDRKRRMNLE